jgi:uncharacterized protein HemX
VVFIAVILELLKVSLGNEYIVAWLLGIVVASGAGLIAMYFRQQRLVREVYGGENDAQPGLLKQQKDTKETISGQIESLERTVDRQFTDLERQMASRDEEMSMRMAKIVANMDDPPEDLEIYGPYHNLEPRDSPNWARQYYVDDETDD